MTPTLEMKPLPLTVDQDDVIRVANTRVTLETLVSAFSDGATPEEIAQQYPTLGLADIYQVLAYYLHTSSEVAFYLRERDAKADASRRQNEKLFDPVGVRARLLARQSGNQ